MPHLPRSWSAERDKLIFVVPTKVRSTRWEVRSESSASLAARHLLSIENTCRRRLPDFILRTSHLAPRTSAYSHLSSFQRFPTRVFCRKKTDFSKKINKRDVLGRSIHQKALRQVAEGQVPPGLLKVCPGWGAPRCLQPLN